MFESVTPDRGTDGLTRAARILYVLAVIVTIGSVLFVITALLDETSLKPVSLAINAIFVVVAWLTACLTVIDHPRLGHWTRGSFARIWRCYLECGNASCRSGLRQRSCCHNADR